MVRVLAAIAVIPSAPVLVPELAGTAADVAAELAPVRTAMLTAAAALPSRWIVVGTGPDTVRIGPDAVGTFAGYGVDLRVQLAPGATDALVELPLCALIAGWVRGLAAPGARAEVRVYRHDLDTDAAVAAGTALRAEIDAAPDAVGVLVVADGAATLTPSAPGSHDPDSVAVQSALDAALAAGDTAALARLGTGVVGRVAYQVLAGLGAPAEATELYRGAPYGVGYFAGVWRPAGWVPAAGGSAP